MALELVTGYWGMEHVTAEQDADLNAGIIGSDNYVLNIGEKMRAEAVSANKVRIFDGIFMAYGRQCILGDGEYEDVTIENGTPGLLRNDMIVVKYKKDEESGKENATFAVLKGETGSVAKDPAPNRQDIRSGAFESEVPMYRVKINGLAIEKIEPLYSIPMTNDDLSQGYNSLITGLTQRNLVYTSEIELKYFCDLVLNRHRIYQDILIPYRIKIPVSWSPNGKSTWFRGFVALQNDSYSYAELGNIIALTTEGVYAGHITISDGNPKIKWKTVITY